MYLKKKILLDVANSMLTMDGVCCNLMSQMPFSMTILRKKFTGRSYLGLKPRSERCVN